MICERCGSDMVEDCEPNYDTHCYAFFDECPECGWRIER